MLFQPHIIPYPNDPWKLWVEGCAITVRIAGHNHDLPMKLTSMAENIAEVASAIERFAAVNRTPADTAPPVIYGVHVKSVLCRIFGRFAQLRGVHSNVFGPASTYNDLFEMSTYPAIVSKEERYSFSPAHIAALLGNPELSNQPMEALWQLTSRFQP